MRGSKHGERRKTDLAVPVEMLLGTGVRIGEPRAIRWEDVTGTVKHRRPAPAGVPTDRAAIFRGPSILTRKLV